MREIKFRAWVQNEDDMYYPEDNGGHGRYLLSMDGKNFRWDEDETGGKYYGFKEIIKLMQYTGLKDKNGKEIYEGDIVKMTDTVHTWKVPQSGVCQVKYLKAVIYPFNIVGVENWEVIGNIYENPELLEGGEK